MRPTFSPSKYGKTSLNHIRQVETEFNFQFPDSFIEFLLAFNGGCPEPDLFLSKHMGPVYVVWFTGFRDPNNNDPDIFDDLREDIDKFWDYLGPYLIPFAGDGVGSYFCLSVSPARYGLIYFWENDTYIPKAMPEDQLHLALVSDSFEEFINSASEVHPEETEFERLLRLKQYEQALAYMQRQDIDVKQEDYLGREFKSIAFHYIKKNKDFKNPVLRDILKRLGSKMNWDRYASYIKD